MGPKQVLGCWAGSHHVLSWAGADRPYTVLFTSCVLPLLLCLSKKKAGNLRDAYYTNFYRTATRDLPRYDRYDRYDEIWHQTVSWCKSRRFVSFLFLPLSFASFVIFPGCYFRHVSTSIVLAYYLVFWTHLSPFFTVKCTSKSLLPHSCKWFHYGLVFVFASIVISHLSFGAISHVIAKTFYFSCLLKWFYYSVNEWCEFRVHCLYQVATKR